MKPASKNNRAALRQQIAEAMRASFKIEGIIITPAQAAKVLENVSAKLEKSAG